MTCLVADVGGTNSRLALIDGDGRMSEPVRVANENFASFEDLLADFFADTGPIRLRGCCVAVAGPVSAGRARLTNRDWAFEPLSIARVLPDGRNVPVRFFNDLVALGYALPELTGTQLTALRPAPPIGGTNGQMLVAGMGTGFNICAVRRMHSGQISVSEAEQGHASLPSSVAARLATALGARAGRFETVEDLFSGRGLARLGRAVTGRDVGDGARLLKAYAQDADSARASDLFSGLLGLFAREMVFQYLPHDGIYFAGGVARGVLGSPARAAFLTAFEAPGNFADLVAPVPVRVITDDAAALCGAAVCLKTAQGAVQ